MHHIQFRLRLRPDHTGRAYRLPRPSIANGRDWQLLSKNPTPTLGTCVSIVVLFQEKKTISAYKNIVPHAYYNLLGLDVNNIRSLIAVKTDKTFGTSYTTVTESD